MCQKMARDSSKCIHCGVGEVGPDNCAACSWPYSENGWRTFKIGLRRITIDTSCINAKQASAPLNLLEKWAKDGKFEIQKATPFSVEAQGNWEREAKKKQVSGHPPLFTLGASFLGSGAVLAGPDIKNEIQKSSIPWRKVLDRRSRTGRSTSCRARQNWRPSFRDDKHAGFHMEE